MPNLFPYTNTHELNLDWILQVVKDFQTKYTNFDQALSDALAAIESGKTEVLEEIAAALTSAEADIVELKNSALSAIGDAQEEALTTLSTSLTNATTAITDQKNAALAALSASVQEGQTIIEQLYNTLPASAQDILGQLQVLDSIITGGQNITFNWQQGTYIYPEGTTPPTPPAVWTESPSYNIIVSSRYITGIAGRRIRITLDNTLKFGSGILLWNNNPPGGAPGGYAPGMQGITQYYADVVIPLNTTAMSIDLMHRDDTPITPAEIEGHIKIEWITDFVGQRIIAPTETSETADVARLTGEYFFLDGDLYIATDNISVGDTIAEHTNCEKKTVGGELSELKSATNAIIYGGNVTKKQTPTIIDGYTVNVANNGALMSTTYYNYSDFMEIPEHASSISLHATFAGTFGLAYYNTNAESGFVGGVDGDHISDYGGTDSSVPQTVVLPVPANARYFRATMRNAYYTEPDDYAIQFIIPIGSLITAESTIAEHTDEIESVNDDIKTIADYHYSKNLLDESQAVAGFITNNGTISTSGSLADYLTSDFVAVEANKTYFVGVFSSYGVYSDLYRKGLLLYDTNKSFISNTYQNTTSALSFTPSANGFVRVSWANANLCMIELGNTHTDYTPYEKALLLNDNFPMTETMREEVAGIASNVLFNKKWAHCGDSFSYYTNKSFDSGIFASKNKTYPRIIAERNGMTLLEQFMLSGRTLAYPEDGTFANALTAPNQSYNYQNIPADTDYITIMLGINDCQHTGSGSTGDGEDATGVITLGTIDDNTTATYYGAWNVVLGWLHTNRPFAHVGIVITNGTTRQDYTEAQIAVAKKWGYPYINLNGDERTPAFIRCYNPDIPTALKDELMQIQGVNNPTDTHPNWQTHELESTIIEAWLRSL